MPELNIFVGFQASGKSTFYTENLLPSFRLVSKDKMSSSKDKQQAGLLEQYLGTGQNVVLDNTNMSVVERAKAIAIGKKHNAKIVCFWFTTPFEECMKRNGQRTGKSKVPTVAMYVARKRFQEPTLAEGFDEIHKIVPAIPPAVKADIIPPKKIPTAKKISAIKEEKMEAQKFARAAIFLDKDGVIVDDSGYPYQIPMYDLLPGAAEALIKLAKQPLPIIVISNQSWVGSGRLTMDEANIIFDTLRKNVAALGGRIDATYFCPHKKNANCQCRKPGIGMLQQAALDFNLDLMGSTLIGDMQTDVECGYNAKVARTVMVKNGERREKGKVQPTHIFADLLEAVNALF